MIDHNYISLLNKILGRIEEEVWIAQEKSGETDVTIFLSVDLFLRLQAETIDMLRLKCYPADYDQFKLFGCSVERYADSGLSFYVTTSKKIRYS
jgi:hypothetical protein